MLQDRPAQASPATILLDLRGFASMSLVPIPNLKNKQFLRTNVHVTGAGTVPRPGLVQGLGDIDWGPNPARFRLGRSSHLENTRISHSPFSVTGEERLIVKAILVPIQVSTSTVLAKQTGKAGKARQASKPAGKQAHASRAGNVCMSRCSGKTGIPDDHGVPCRLQTLLGTLW
jgi:hypothetical protein